MKRLLVALPLLIVVISGPVSAGVSVSESKVLDRWTLCFGVGYAYSDYNLGGESRSIFLGNFN